MENKKIKFISKLSTPNLYFCAYDKSLDKAINNFSGVHTVKVIKNTCFINKISFGYFIEILMRDNVAIEIITTLHANK